MKGCYDMQPEISPHGRSAFASKCKSAWKFLRDRPSLIFMAGAVFFFSWLAEEVGEGDTHEFDKALLLALRDPANLSIPVGPKWLPSIFVYITALGGTVVLTVITVLTVFYLMTKKKQLTAALVVLAICGGTIFGNLLKHGFVRPRPDLVAHLVKVSSLSFPSTHTMLATITYFTLGALLVHAEDRVAVRIFILCIATTIVFLVGVSRVYLGVHWPTDVIAGWCAGAAWAILSWSAADWLEKRAK